MVGLTQAECKHVRQRTRGVEHDVELADLKDGVPSTGSLAIYIIDGALEVLNSGGIDDAQKASC